jgi:hypothetical protein
VPEVRDELCHAAALASADRPVRLKPPSRSARGAVKTSNDRAYPRTQHAWLLLKQDKVRDAIHELDEILTSSPDHAPARQLRAAIFLDQKRVHEAERDCAKLDEPRVRISGRPRRAARLRSSEAMRRLP